MRQSIVEVIAYLLDMAAYQAIDAAICFADHAIVKQRLEAAGFAKDVVASAFDWLQELIEQQSWYDNNVANPSASGAAATRTVRIFSLEEAARVDPEVRNFILSLEFSGVLDTKMREIVINQLVQLRQKSVELTDAKWVVLLVLMSKSNKSIQDIHNYLLATM